VCVCVCAAQGLCASSASDSPSDHEALESAKERQWGEAQHAACSPDDVYGCYFIDTHAGEAPVPPGNGSVLYFEPPTRQPPTHFGVVGSSLGGASAGGKVEERESTGEAHIDI